MNKVTVKEAQAYLTVRYDDRTRKIVNVKRLLKRHKPDEILDFLNSFFQEQEKTLHELVTADKTNPRINEIISTMFRVKMAISTLERGTS